MEQGSFVPIDQRFALARGARVCGRAEGAVLVADLEGSTAFIEALVAMRGERRSVELLGSYLNALFRALITRVHALHGAVISFGGDAITCWFPDPHQRAALQCAFELRTLVAGRPWTPPEPDLPAPPGIKLSVATGSAWRSIVGDPALQCLDVLAGPVVQRAWAGERLARGGEIVVDEATLGGAGGRVEAIAWRESPALGRFATIGEPQRPFGIFPWTGAPPPLPPGGSRWLHPQVEQRLRSLGAAFFDEFRFPSIVFARSPGLDATGGSEAERALDAFVRGAQSCFERFGGLLLNLVMDDRGCSLYGAIGALVAHEDDSLRAVEAARALAVDGRWDLAAGVARGPVYAGSYGCPERRTYGLLGREVHVASRLAELAVPGDLLVTARVAQEIGEAFALEDRGGIDLRGIAQQVSVLRVLGRRAVGGGARRGGPAAQRFVGRGPELDGLLADLEAAGRGEGRVVWLEGDAGVGKSALVQQLARVAGQRGLPVLCASGEPLDQGSPYRALEAMLRGVLDLQDCSEAEAGARLAALLERRQVPQAQAGLLAPVLGLPGLAGEAQEALEPAVRAVGARLLVCRLLTAWLQERGGGALVLVEDVQWFDESSWALLHEIVRGIPGLLVVASSRVAEAEIARNCQRLIEVPGEADGPRRFGRRLHLPPLPAQDTRALACAALGCEALSAEVESLVLGRSEGNPFFAIALATELCESGRVRVVAGVARLAAGGRGGGDAIPLTVRDLVVSRMDRLEQDQQVVVKVASVIGRVFRVDTLRDVLGTRMDRAALLRHLRGLQARGILLPSSSFEPRTYVFGHAITREATYSMLLEAQRADLHRAVAGWWELHGGEQRGPLQALLAHHWERAGEHGRALACVLGAGEHALKSSANEEAASFFRRALAALDAGLAPAEEAALRRAELGLGAALVNLAGYREACGHIERGLVLLGQPMPRGRVGIALRTLGHAGLQLLHRLLPGRFFGRLAREAPRLREAARALEKLAEAYFITGQPTPAYHAGFAWLNVAEAAGPSPELARAYVSLGAALAVVPMRGLAAFYLEQAMLVLAAHDDPATRSFVLLLDAFARAGTGDWAEAVACIERSSAIGRELGDGRRVGDCLSLLVPIHALRGERETAARLARQHVEHCRRWRSPRSLCEALVLRGTFVGELGGAEPAEDLAELERLLSERPELSDGFLRMGEQALRGRVALAAGDRTAARASALAALAEARSYKPNLFYSLPSFTQPAETLVALAGDDPAAAGRDLEHALGLCGTFAGVFPIATPARLRLEAQAARLGGAPRRALRLAGRARAEAARFGLAPEEAQARALLEHLTPVAPGSARG